MKRIGSAFIETLQEACMQVYMMRGKTYYLRSTDGALEEWVLHTNPYAGYCIEVKKRGSDEVKGYLEFCSTVEEGQCHYQEA